MTPHFSVLEKASGRPDILPGAITNSATVLP
jgi:hypothetical protein